MIGRAMAWTRADPRGKLAVAWLVHLILCIVFFTAQVGAGPAEAARLLTLFYVLPVLVPVNGWVLRQRHRSLLWLLFHIAGLGLVPILIALLAKPGRPE